MLPAASITESSPDRHARGAGFCQRCKQGFFLACRRLRPTLVRRCPTEMGNGYISMPYFTASSDCLLKGSGVNATGSKHTRIITGSTCQRCRAGKPQVRLADLARACLESALFPSRLIPHREIKPSRACRTGSASRTIETPAAWDQRAWPRARPSRHLAPLDRRRARRDAWLRCGRCRPAARPGPG